MSIHLFLKEFNLRHVTAPENFPFHVVGLALGKGNYPVEILVSTHDSEPRLPVMRSCWKLRNAGRPAPLLLIVLYENKAAFCGPIGEDPPAYIGLDLGQVERICREALEQSDRHAALRSLRDSLPALTTELAGLRNEGFLATHELISGVRLRPDWVSSGEKAKKSISKHGEELFYALGYQVEPLDRVVSILRSTDRKVGLAVLLRENESPEIQAERFSELSPISYALTVADRENLPYILIQHGAKIRIYPTKVGVGVGRRGRTETFIECHTSLLRDNDASYLWLLFSAEALAEGGSLEEIIEDSKRFSGELAEKLRERIYQKVIPQLASGIVEARKLEIPSAEDLSQTYEMAMTVLFRLLFIAYGEDKDLLPYRWNGLYHRRSLKEKARELLQLAKSGSPFDKDDTHWEEIKRLFRAVERGNQEWGVPQYDGDLFSSDPEISPVGALLEDLSLPNTLLGPALRDLLLVDTPEGLGPVDFRSLGIHEFGTIYEGLLESELSVADTNLSIDNKGFYRPCHEKEEPLVSKGDVYLHNASGARKTTGSYFTKSFAVEHLIDNALEPALRDHLTRLDKLDDENAGKRLFDFRVADIAMGSGHFLIAAIDRIERALTGYLSKRKLSTVTHELTSLRRSAREALGLISEQVEIEDTQLLRRLIARRCIYGVDINDIAVQLARLGIWIHTFVPGLPLSFLDHNLVCGNSLIGIGQLSEINDKIEEDNLPIFRINAKRLLGNASEPLMKLAHISEATISEVTMARKVHKEVLSKIESANALCDLVTGYRILGKPLSNEDIDWEILEKEIVNSPEHSEAKDALENLQPFHFPISFPEVFLRDREGFDVILGNPPWDEATVEEDAFWARYNPGLRSLPQREQELFKEKLRRERSDLQAVYEKELHTMNRLRHALVRGPYPGMGTGDPDLYKAFCWRFWHLVSAEGGRIGVVLPRSALIAKGSQEFRLNILSNAEEFKITMLLNNRQWFFEDVHPQYTIGLISVTKRKADKTVVELDGPYHSMHRYEKGREKDPYVFYGDDIMSWNDTASLPLLPTEESINVFTQLRKSPRLDLNDWNSWRARPHRELDATNDKKYMDVDTKDCPQNFWPIYKGESFDIWNPDTGTYYAWGNPEVVIPVLQKKRVRGGKNARSAFSEFPPSILRDIKTLSCQYARIAFRDVSRATDSRTVRVALIPPRVFITNKGPYFLWPRGTNEDQAYLLGILSSIPLDWYARRFVETTLNFYILNPFPIPRPVSDSYLRLRIIELAGRLACPDERFSEWADKVGVECGPIDSDEKEDMINELDAVVAHLYGLEEKHLVHIFETFHEGWDYEDRLRATLKHYNLWRGKL